VRRLRPARDLTDPTQGVKAALRTLARRYTTLTAEITDADAQLAVLVKQAQPDLLAIRGVGVETAAQLLATCGDNPDRLHPEAAFASLCGVSPVPASSGKTRRHRLNRGGDRQANRALYMIVITCIGHDDATRNYVERRIAKGLSKKEIIRCLSATSPMRATRSSPARDPTTKHLTQAA
jgi:transposase